MEAKETTYKNILKLNIISFLCYSILIGFIFLLAVLILKTALNNMTNTTLSIILSLICSILIFNLLHFICKSSTLETLKNQKMNEKNAEIFMKKMNLFFIVCAIISVLICLGYLFINTLIYSNAIQQAHIQYDFISQELTEKIINNIVETYHSTFLSEISSTIIIELSFVISFFSLIPYQKKTLEKYNK